MASKLYNSYLHAEADSQKGDSFFNKAETPDKHICVNCEATDCVHNENCECKAERIGIVGGHVYDSKETECATFKCRCG